MNGLMFTLILVFGILCFIASMVKTLIDRDNRTYNRDETETIQALHRDLERMATRVEALETILLDQNEAYRRTPPPVPRHDHDRVSRY